MHGPDPFFVGGTGRSGTTQLTAVIGQHPVVHALPDETRFLIDPGGLEDLAHALTVAYTPYHGDDALRRFDRLMRVRLTGQSMTAFRGWDVPAMVGPARYWAALERLTDRLVWYSFDEGVPVQAGQPTGDVTEPMHEPATFRRVVPRYFPNRPELMALLREFVEELFSGAAAKHGKRTWCEKTPFNVLSAPFLWELFPEATIIHVTRHPVGVVASHMHQPWAPAELEHVVAWLSPVYERWFRVREGLDRSRRRLVEVRLEDLAHDWPRQRRLLFEAMGLDDAVTQAGFEQAAMERRADQLSPDERAYVVGELGWAIERLGYDPTS